MKILMTPVLIASACLLAACGGDMDNVPSAAAPMQLASSVTTVATGPSVPPPAPAALPAPPPSAAAPPPPQQPVQRTTARTRMPSALDGLWQCRADDGQGATLRLDIAGNAVRDTGSQQMMALSQGKGIELGIRLLDYHDKESGQLTHARKLRQVDKPGFASVFTASANAGAGTGAEFSLNPNDTLKISDYSSMRGTESVGQVVPMTCYRERTPASA